MFFFWLKWEIRTESLTNLNPNVIVKYAATGLWYIGMLRSYLFI